MSQWENMNFTSPSFTQLTSTIALDPSKISLATVYDTRVYFIGEATNDQNALGFNTEGGGVTGGNAQLIFPNASEAWANGDSAAPVRTISNPLLPGDFVDLGTLGSGALLDFFLISQKSASSTNVFSTETSLNPDGIQHALIFARADSPYLFIAFDDKFGGNGSFKGDFFAVDIGTGNVHALTNMPEPSTLLILCSFLALVIYRKYSLNLQCKFRIT